MTDRPYTDDDLRAAAARLHASAARDADERIRPTVQRNWTQLDADQLDEACDEMTTLLDGAANTSAWAVNLGADSLQPSDEHVITVNGNSRPIARIHFAFEPGMPDDMRAALVEGIGQAIADAL